jgi:hypothetical protein
MRNKLFQLGSGVVPGIVVVAVSNVVVIVVSVVVTVVVTVVSVVMTVVVTVVSVVMTVVVTVDAVVTAKAVIKNIMELEFFHFIVTDKNNKKKLNSCVSVVYF